MITSPFVYLSIFTVSNVMIASYLQTAVNLYKAEGKLPDWAIFSRKILDRLDEPIDGKEFKIEEEKEEDPANLFNMLFDNEFKDDKKAASMSFLQIKPFEKDGQMYDFRDEHEYKMSTRSQADLKKKYQADIDIERINTMNTTRETENRLFKDLANVEKELYENDKSKNSEAIHNYKSFNEKKKESRANGLDQTIEELKKKVEEIISK